MAGISIRAQRLEVYIRDHPHVKMKDRSVSVRLCGELKVLEGYRIEVKTDYLIYNIRNGRFQAELNEKEEELKRRLDPNDEKDSMIVQQLLLQQNPLETEALKENLRQFGQMDSGIITFDGTVIDGNRRMAILKSLYQETGDPRFRNIMVGRLPQGVEERDLWRIEADTHLAKGFELKYGGVNELLKLQEGVSQGYSEEDISGALNGRWTPSQIHRKLEIFRLIESYLETIGHPGQYHRVLPPKTDRALF